MWNQNGWNSWKISSIPTVVAAAHHDRARQASQPVQLIVQIRSGVMGGHQINSLDCPPWAPRATYEPLTWTYLGPSPCGMKFFCWILSFFPHIHGLFWLLHSQLIQLLAVATRDHDTRPCLFSSWTYRNSPTESFRSRNDTNLRKDLNAPIRLDIRSHHITSHPLFHREKDLLTFSILIIIIKIRYKLKLKIPRVGSSWSSRSTVPWRVCCKHVTRTWDRRLGAHPTWPVGETADRTKSPPTPKRGSTPDLDLCANCTKMTKISFSNQVLRQSVRQVN